MKKKIIILVMLATIIGLSVNAQTPTVSISASANPICEGTSTTLTASGATTYSWCNGWGLQTL